MRLKSALLACTIALAACSGEQAPAQPTAATVAPSTTQASMAAADANAPPVKNVAPNLLSFANGTIMPTPFEGLLVTAPILMIDGSSMHNWVGDGKRQSFVFELPEAATLRTLEFDNDTSGMGGVDAGIKDFTVEVSVTSADDGYQEIFSGTLEKGVNGQRFDVARALPGRWVRANFTSNHGGDSFSLTEIRAFGARLPPALTITASGSYKTIWGVYHLAQTGTSISGCFEPDGLYAQPATFSGGIEGNLARVQYIELDSEGTPGNPTLLLFVFARDGQRFFTAAVDGDSVSEYREVARVAAQPGACAGRNTAKDGSTLVSEMAKAGRAVVYGINFDFNSATIRPESTAMLEQVAGLLRDDSELRITIEGHTDDIGGDAFNQALSETRANAVRGWLVALGITSDRLQAAGKGAGTPIASNGTDIGRAQNRRVELVRR